MIQTTEEMYCDRCGKKIGWPKGIRLRKKLLIQFEGRPDYNFYEDPHYNNDLCNECYKAFKEWWKAGKQS